MPAAPQNPQGQGNGKQLQVELHDIQGGEMKQDEQAQQEADAQLKAEIEEAAENIVGKFEQVHRRRCKFCAWHSFMQSPLNIPSRSCEMCGQAGCSIAT